MEGDDATLRVTTVQQAETVFRPTEGYREEKWREFKAKVPPGDVVVAIRTSPASWEDSRGMEGYALMRPSRNVKYGIELAFALIDVYIVNVGSVANLG